MATDTQALFDPIDKAVTAALHDNHIYPISSYGWLDAYTADPKMIGHAMWQTEPPFEFSYGTESEQSEPTEYQRYLTILGADFEGLMELACNSLGIVLWRQNETIVDHFGDNAKFWSHYTGTLLILSMASDRLRDFFVMAYFNVNFTKYRSQKREFRGPFVESRLSPRGVGTQLKKLLPLVEEIQKNRSIRNKLVHEVATRSGKMNQSLFNSRRKALGKEPIREAKQSWGKWKQEVAREIKDSGRYLSGWYNTLVSASNLVFEIEHRLRKKRQRGA